MDALTSFVSEYGFHWFWFGVATVLLFLEVVVGRFMLMAASVGAVIMGALTGMYTYVGFEIQILFFVVLSAGLMWVTRSFLQTRVQQSAQLKDIVENQRYVGREFKLVNPIERGRSSINIDGVVWRIEGNDCPEGSRVRIVAMGEGYLAVESA